MNLIMITHWDCYLRYEGATSHEGGPLIVALFRPLSDVDNVWGLTLRSDVSAVRRLLTLGWCQFPYSVSSLRALLVLVDGIWG